MKNIIRTIEEISLINLEDVNRLKNDIIYIKDINNVEINLKIKNILENMRSILDYIAYNLNQNYCTSKYKVYFPYIKIGECQSDFDKVCEENFPSLKVNQPQIYNILINNQTCNDNTNWIFKLITLTNEVKHRKLYLCKEKIEKETIIKNQEKRAVIKGNLHFKKADEQILIFGDGDIYTNTNMMFNADGNLMMGNGTYNVISNKKNNIEIEHKVTIKTSVFDENVIDILMLIINKENLLINELKPFLV